MVGFAEWSGLDFKALTAMTGSRQGQAISIFNIDDCENAAAIQKFMPGVANFYRSPIIAIYLNGRLTRFLQAKEARDWMVRSDW